MGTPVTEQRSTPAASVDAKRLAAHLRSAIKGEVRFGDGDRALYATDASNYRQVPIGVVVPKDASDVMTAMEICRRYDAPFLSRGGGTSLAGQCCNVAVVLDMSKHFNRIVEMNPGEGYAWVEPGIVLDTLRDAAEEHNLTFAPDPSTHNHCTIGGMIGNNSCGVHSVMGGKTDDNVYELDILTYDGLRMTVGPTSDEELERIIAEGGRRGQIYRDLRDLRDRYADQVRARFPKIPRRVSGYALDQLLPENGFNVAKALVGSEGTCVCVLGAKVRLVPSPQHRCLLVLGYPDVYTAGDHIQEVLESGVIGLEGLDDNLVRDMTKKGLHPKDVALLPPGGGWLLAEFGADSLEAARAQAQALMDRLQHREDAPSMKLFTDPWEEHVIWTVRESGLGATARVPGERDTWEGWEDSAVDAAQLGAYLREFRALLRRYGYACSLYGHFGQGCVHTRIDFDLKSAHGIEHFRAFLDDAADLVVKHGGSLSGEHGDGQSRAALLPKMYGDDLVRAFEEFKAIWDPENRMNPGKVVHAYAPTENLRYGVTYEPKHPQTFFQFPDDHFSIAYAMERCVGVGECRRHAGGVMCPSYQATREEKHSTRGRARLLWEMLHGDAVTKGWRDEAVKESLDLCLACKGCKGDCPMNVDMAMYKAEFNAHYYAHRLRPTAAYTMGLIYWWARLASHMPGMANALSHGPVVRAIAKRLGGIAPEREIPRFAHQTFRDWFRERPASAATGRRVILWPDTFTNHLLPGRAKAAVEVLEAAGYRVEIPSRPLCCGRPLYDWGMLSQAKGLWKQVLDELRPAIREGVPVVGLEPSCLSAFRDELPNLLPHDQDAQRLATQAFTLSELLINHTKDYQPPKVAQEAIVQAHCHHRSVLKFDAEMELMRRMGLETETPETGCCGMAGSFGFERGEKYRISMQCAERALLPAVRGAPGDRLVIADGFICREQIRQGTGRQARHISEVLADALREKGAEPGATADQPDQREHHVLRDIAVSGVAVAGAAALIGTVAVRAQHRGERRKRTDGRRERRRMRLRR